MTRKKGNRIRRKAKSFYENKGYKVDYVEKTGRFIKYKDLFGKLFDDEHTDKGFDMMCIKDGEVILCQVKTNKPATQAWYKEFAENFASENFRVICWTWYDRDGPRIQEYLPDRSIEEVDLRKSSNEGEKKYEI